MEDVAHAYSLLKRTNLGKQINTIISISIISEKSRVPVAQGVCGTVFTMLSSSVQTLSFCDVMFF